MHLVQSVNTPMLLTTIAQSAIQLALHVLVEVAQIASLALFLNTISLKLINACQIVTLISLFLPTHQSVSAVTKHVSLASALLP